jgi:hypothetical protein
MVENFSPDFGDAVNPPLLLAEVAVSRSQASRFFLEVEP